MNTAGPDAADWRLLTDLIAARFGLSFEGARQDILEARLVARLKALRLDTFREYYHFLRLHPGRENEFDLLAQRLTNNETYFFREALHFDILIKHVVPALAPQLSGQPFRLLSAGCSSGEEPYSVAVKLADAGLSFAGLKWEIDACDLNAQRLAQARAGVYEDGALRVCDEATRKHCFTESNGHYRLRDHFRKGVRFFQANLAATVAGLGWGSYHAIFCRNVLIYFGEAAFLETIERLGRALMPGGYLFLGHAESLIDRSPSFDPCYLDGAMIYRRRED